MDVGYKGGTTLMTTNGLTNQSGYLLVEKEVNWAELV